MAQVPASYPFGQVDGVMESEAKLITRISELFDHKFDDDVIRIILENCDWKEDQAIEKLLEFSTDSTPVQDSPIGLQIIACSLLETESNTNKSEDQTGESKLQLSDRSPNRVAFSTEQIDLSELRHTGSEVSEVYPEGFVGPDHIEIPSVVSVPNIKGTPESTPEPHSHTMDSSSEFEKMSSKQKESLGLSANAAVFIPGNLRLCTTVDPMQARMEESCRPSYWHSYVGDQEEYFGLERVGICTQRSVSSDHCSSVTHADYGPGYKDDFETNSHSPARPNYAAAAATPKTVVHSRVQPAHPSVAESCHSTNVQKVKNLIQDGVKLLIIMRGLPGSGKSFLARQIQGPGEIFSTDDFYMHGDVYRFSKMDLHEAHDWNRSRVQIALDNGVTPVIIDNTNISMWEMEPYAKLAYTRGYTVEILEPETSWRFNPKSLEKHNTHRVPFETIKRMKARYEKIDSASLMTHVKKIVKKRGSPGAQQMAEASQRSHSAPSTPEKGQCDAAKRQPDISIPNKMQGGKMDREHRKALSFLPKRTEDEEKSIQKSAGYVRINNHKDHKQNVVDDNCAFKDSQTCIGGSSSAVCNSAVSDQIDTSKPVDFLLNSIPWDFPQPKRIAKPRVFNASSSIKDEDRDHVDGTSDSVRTGTVAYTRNTQKTTAWEKPMPQRSKGAHRSSRSSLVERRVIDINMPSSETEEVGKTVSSCKDTDDKNTVVACEEIKGGQTVQCEDIAGKSTETVCKELKNGETTSACAETEHGKSSSLFEEAENEEISSVYEETDNSKTWPVCQDTDDRDTVPVCEKTEDGKVLSVCDAVQDGQTFSMCLEMKDVETPSVHEKPEGGIQSSCKESTEMLGTLSDMSLDKKDASKYEDSDINDNSGKNSDKNVVNEFEENREVTSRESPQSEEMGISELEEVRTPSSSDLDSEDDSIVTTEEESTVDTDDQELELADVAHRNDTGCHSDFSEEKLDAEVHLANASKTEGEEPCKVVTQAMKGEDIGEPNEPFVLMPNSNSCDPDHEGQTEDRVADPDTTHVSSSDCYHSASSEICLSHDGSPGDSENISPASPKKKERNKRYKFVQEPFLKDRLQEELISGNWKSLTPERQIEETVLKRETDERQSHDSDPELANVSKRSVASTQTEGKDFSVTFKGTANPQDQYTFLVPRSNFTSADNFDFSSKEHFWKHMYDKGTVVDIHEEACEDWIYSVFPGIPAGHLNDVLDLCNRDVVWAVELMQDMDFTSPVKPYDKHRESKDSSHLRISENASNANEKKDPLKLVDLCMKTVPNESADVQQHVIDSSKQRLQRIQSREYEKLQSMCFNETSTRPADPVSSANGPSHISGGDYRSHSISGLELLCGYSSDSTSSEYNSDIDPMLVASEEDEEGQVCKVKPVTAALDARFQSVDDHHSESSEKVSATSAPPDQVRAESPAGGISPFTLSAGLVSDLEELFGKLSIPDRGAESVTVHLDFDSAHMLHQLIQQCLNTQQLQSQEERHRQLREDEALAQWLQNEEEVDRTLESVSGISSQPAMSLPDSDAFRGSVHNITRSQPSSPLHRRSHQPVSLREIMKEEMTQHEAYEKQMNYRKGKKITIATVLKQRQLHELYPFVEKSLLNEILLANDHSLPKAKEVLASLCEKEFPTSHKLKMLPAEENVSADDIDGRSLMARTVKSQNNNDLSSRTLQYSAESAGMNFSEIRQKAAFHYNMRRDCLNKAHEAHGRGMKTVAVFYSEKAKEHYKQMKSANQEASEQIIESRRERLESEMTLDLHGLYLTEVLSLLESTLTEKEKEYREKPTPNRQHLFIITGRGKNSRNGTARLRPGVVAYLENRNYKYKMVNPGMVKVSF